MSAIRGRAAENAVKLAAVHYKRAGKADIAKQATPMRKTASGWKFSKKSPVDFKGALASGQSIYIEVKQHAGVSFPLAELAKDQRDALDVAVRMNVETWLLIDLYDIGEAFICEWRRVQDFLRAPYRSSLSLQWLRAHAYICKATDRETPEFKIWFLDYADHPGRATAYLAEAAERAKSPIVDLERPIEGKAAVAEKLTIEQRKANVRAAAESYVRKNARKGWAR